MKFKISKSRTWKIFSWGGVLGFGSLVFVLCGFLVFDHNYPPPLPTEIPVSRQVIDRDGNLLRAFSTTEGRWRLPTTIEQVDEQYLKLLLAYEDKRFWSHRGVDPLALIRALGQFVSNGKIVSGGSTITMQLARLLEPRKQRSIGSKLFQIVRALQLERRLSKKEILNGYLTHAPFGGNLEGVRAASFAYFGKEPKGLSLSQAALLVALPQAPERRRPDRFHSRAERTRNTVLQRMARLKVIASGEVERAASTTVSKLRHPLPHFAAHLTQRMINQKPQMLVQKLTVKLKTQRALEDVARDAIVKFDTKTSLAMMLVDATNGDVLASVGSPNYTDFGRSGWIDMTRAIRSPGSTLKPFIYGLAFEEGLVAPQTLIMDSPSNFSGYRPQNFEMKYQGEVSVSKALQMSLNVPAVHILEAVGPARLVSRFKRVNVGVALPKLERPGLAIGLGGMGISLKDLVQLYTGFANDGQVVKLKTEFENPRDEAEKNRLLRPSASWKVVKILSNVRPPQRYKRENIAFKTGTSYGYRDAWSIGFDGRYVLGVWVGRADNGSVSGITGYKSATPILFEAFARSGLKRVPLKPSPFGSAIASYNELPVTLKRFRNSSISLTQNLVPELSPSIVYPPDGARIEMAKTMAGEPIPLVIKIQNGRPPFRWLANGELIASQPRKRTLFWSPDGNGFSRLTVIDATGRAASVNVFLQ